MAYLKDYWPYGASMPHNKLKLIDDIKGFLGRLENINASLWLCLLHYKDQGHMSRHRNGPRKEIAYFWQ